MGGFRQVRNHRFDAIAGTTEYVVITGEVHAIPGSGTYRVRLNEYPDADYAEPTSGTSLYVRTPASSTAWTQVSGSPGLNEYRVDETYLSGWVEFNSGNADDVILVNYRGTGSNGMAEMINSLNYAGICSPSPIPFGDGSDGDVTISADTTLTVSPAGAISVYKQYANLTVEAGWKVDITAGLRGAILCVSGLLDLEAAAYFDVTGRGGTTCEAAGFGGGGGGGSTGNDGTAGGGALSVGIAPGIGGAGGVGLSVGAAGTNLISAPSQYWRTLNNLLAYGSGGGNGFGGAAGGVGSGFLVIFANVLRVGAGVLFNCNGSAGAAGGVSPGGGGGAGGQCLIIAGKLVGDTAANVKANMVNIAGGAGGTGTAGGGAGADGFKEVIELYSYNIR